MNYRRFIKFNSATQTPAIAQNTVGTETDKNISTFAIEEVGKSSGK